MLRSRKELKLLRACSLLNLLSLLAEGFEGLPNIQVHYFQEGFEGLPDIQVHYFQDYG